MSAAGLLGVCLMLAGAPDVAPRFVPVQAFTLAWTHSIERTRWEEDYTIEQNAPESRDASPRLIAGQARIRGSGAGMEPPPDAVHDNGVYAYQPDPHPPVPLRLTRSRYTPDYEWCSAGRCVPMSAVMPSDGGVTLLYPCRQP